MRTWMRPVLVTLLLNWVSPGLVLGGSKNYVAPEIRTVAGGRDLQITVPQYELKPNIDPSRATAFGALVGGLLVFTLIDLGINDAKVKEVESAVVPLRDALKDYDFDARLQGAATAMLKQIPWFDLKQSRVGKDLSEQGLVEALNAVDVEQVMFLACTYETDPEFASLIVTLNAKFVNKAMPKDRRVQKPSMRFWPKHVPFDQTVRSVVPLPGADRRNPQANVEALSADGAKMARVMLELAIERSLQLLKRTMEMTANEAAETRRPRQRKVSKVRWVEGHVLESDDTHMLVYSRDAGWLTHFEKVGSVNHAFAQAGISSAGLDQVDESASTATSAQ